jgi:ABC-2 type transport system ATP-binding protein
VRVGTPRELTSAEVEVEIRYRRDGEEVRIETEDTTRVLHELTGEALAAGRELEGLEVRRPSLEDVYLAMIGPAGADSEVGSS